MRRFWYGARAAVFVCASSALWACGANIQPKQLDEPCTRTAQCDTGLVCLTGVCQPDTNSGAGGAGGAP